MSSLSGFLNKRIVLITTEGRMFVGKLEGYDQATNLVLSSTEERIIHLNEPGEILKLGTYLIRGDLVVLCGLIDEQLDAEINWEKVRGKQLPATRNLNK